MGDDLRSFVASRIILKVSFELDSLKIGENDISIYEERGARGKKVRLS